jgi:hypothetical protein
MCKDGILAPETVHVGELTVIDFPITDLFDDSLCLLWLERHLHPNGFVCPRCGSAIAGSFATKVTMTPTAAVYAMATTRS